MARKRIHDPNVKTHVEQRPDADVKEAAESGRILVKIAVEELNDSNIGFVLANLRFYTYDARNSDYPGKFPFKVYESCYELGTSVKKKVAEFATKKDLEEGFAKIKEAYIANFTKRYNLVEKPGFNPGPVKRRQSRKKTAGVRESEDATVSNVVPVPAEQHDLPSGTKATSTSDAGMVPREEVGSSGSEGGASSPTDERSDPATTS